jgi:putative phosphoribosyl transferase
MPDLVPVDLVADHLPEPVVIPVDHVELSGILTLPPDPAGVVVFAHGSGSSRHSSRNRYVADQLVRGRVGTLLFDLLTKEEERDRNKVFDIPLLAKRLAQVAAWVQTRPACAGLPLGYFGASTGAAAALVAAADPTAPLISAVVSRGGRPDLAAGRLEFVRAPTLLIVGGADRTVLRLNEDAQAHLRVSSRIVVVPEATHLFEEPGALTVVAAQALSWFRTHFRALAPQETP